MLSWEPTSVESLTVGEEGELEEQGAQKIRSADDAGHLSDKRGEEEEEEEDQMRNSQHHTYCVSITPTVAQNLNIRKKNLGNALTYWLKGFYALIRVV